MDDMASGLEALLGRQVVLDTAGPVVFLGTLGQIRTDGFWLDDADFRDSAEGHDSKEQYICNAREQGIRRNRGRIFVFAHVVISASALDEVVTD